MKRIVFYTAVVVGLIGCGGGGSNNGSDNSSAVKIISEDSFNMAPSVSQSQINERLKAINDERDKKHNCGGQQMGPSPHVSWSKELYLASAEHNYDMAKSNIIDKKHRGSNTQYDWTKVVQNLKHASYVQERVENNGYTNWKGLTENLTAGYINKDSNKPINTPQRAVQQWLNSPGHCKNLMDPSVDEVGMAYLHDTSGTYNHYWTQNFGKR